MFSLVSPGPQERHLRKTCPFLFIVTPKMAVLTGKGWPWDVGGSLKKLYTSAKDLPGKHRTSCPCALLALRTCPSLARRWKFLKRPVDFVALVVSRQNHWGSRECMFDLRAPSFLTCRYSSTLKLPLFTQSQRQPVHNFSPASPTGGSSKVDDPNFECVLNLRSFSTAEAYLPLPLQVLPSRTFVTRMFSQDKSLWAIDLRSHCHKASPWQLRRNHPFATYLVTSSKTW